MKPHTLNIHLLVLTLNCVAAQAWGYTAVFTSPPSQVPTRGMPDGPLLGNGNVGVVLAGPPEAQSFHIGKNDFWTRHPGDARVIVVGSLTLKIPALQGATYRQEQDIALAEVRGAFAKDGLTVRTRSRVDAHENLLLTELLCDGKEPISGSLHLFPGELKAGMGNGGDAKAGWFIRKADDLPGQGREVAVAARVLGADGTEFTLKPGIPVTLATAILSDLDVKDFSNAAKELTANLTVSKIAALETQHRAWWSNYWARSFIEIPDKEIEKRWHAALYVMGSCSRPGRIAPGLWGNWPTTESPNWHGDFHLNYNFQAPFYMVYSANHADLSLPIHCG